MIIFKKTEKLNENWYKIDDPDEGEILCNLRKPSCSCKEFMWVISNKWTEREIKYCKHIIFLKHFYKEMK